MSVPAHPKIYHILHVDRLESVLMDQWLWCDAEVQRRCVPGTTIGMSGIKQRRLLENFLASHPELMVGHCVPFYFCPRSIMLYLIYQANHPELSYTGGQASIIHLEADLHATIAWADAKTKRWAFTLSNAGSRFFEDYASLTELPKINWEAVQATRWSGTGTDGALKEGKQAEFLLEGCFPWALVERIGVRDRAIYQQVANLLAGQAHKPQLEVRTDWYY